MEFRLLIYPKNILIKMVLKEHLAFYFKNHHKTLPVPFGIYADFECTTEKISGCQPSDKKSYTEKYQKHTACSFGYKVVCHYDKSYSGDYFILSW